MPGPTDDSDRTPPGEDAPAAAAPPTDGDITVELPGTPGEGTAAPGDAPVAPSRRRPARTGPPAPQWPQEPREGYTAVGRVLRPHSLKGELRVQSFAASGVNLQVGGHVYLAGERRRILRARSDREAWILKLQGLADRTAVEGFRGALLEVRDKDLRRDDDESYFIHELLGLRVVLSEDGRELGRVAEVLQPGGNDVYVVRDDGGREYLIPAVGPVIDRIDVGEGVMAITPLPGMVDEPK
ncbi:MAG: 16S rRNA processing protein RimM [Dehalococcoidia bacterium]|nr:16S rRNA processing protein RimM [Dehalococcoidia bacterium]